MSGDEALIAAAMRLRAAAPQAWDEFLGALRVNAARAMQEMVGAPSDLVFKAQGRAMAHQELVARLLAAPDIQAKHEQKLKENHGLRTSNSNPGAGPNPGSSL